MNKQLLTISALGLALSSQVEAGNWSLGAQVGYSHTSLKMKTPTGGWTMKSSPSAGAFNGVIVAGHHFELHGKGGLLVRLLGGYDSSSVHFATLNNTIKASYKPRWQTGLGLHYTRDLNGSFGMTAGVDGLMNFARTEQKDTTTQRKSSHLFSLVPTLGLTHELAAKTMWNLEVGYKFGLNSSKLYRNDWASWKFKTKPHGVIVRTGLAYKF